MLARRARSNAPPRATISTPTRERSSTSLRRSSSARAPRGGRRGRRGARSLRAEGQPRRRAAGYAGSFADSWSSTHGRARKSRFSAARCDGHASCSSRRT
jgi:hypothetical protein